MRAVLASLVTILFSSLAIASSESLEAKAAFLCDTVLNQKPYDYNVFSPDFIQAIPETHFRVLIADIIETVGTCETFEKLDVNGNKTTYKFISRSTRFVNFGISIDSQGLIDGFYLKEVGFPDVVLNSWEDAESYLKTWNGRASLSIENFARETLIEKDGAEAHPLGSSFKLYVLGAVADLVSGGTLKWEQTFPIRPEWKSLPSGIMHTWADGKPVSLKTFAEYMIEISDNTATDHLIHIVGRAQVESQLRLMGNSYESLNRPFLTTAEMFKIKWAAPLDLIMRFIKGDESDRRHLLQNEIAPIPLSKVGTNGVSTPTFIKEIEWFGSTNDLCQAMKSLKEKNSPEVMKALSKSVPFLELGAQSHWSYGGYKGGSEPGVLTMTYLLQSKNSEWGCVSLAWHNESQNVNQWIFFDFASKVLKLAESYF